MRMRILPLVAKYAIGRSFVGKNIFSSISQIRINYRNSTLSNHNDEAAFKIKAGDRMPYFLVDGESIYNKLSAPKFHLLVFSNSVHGHLDLQREFGSKYNDSIDFNQIYLTPTIASIFGTNHPFRLVLRPDNYIGLIALEIALVNLENYMGSPI